MPMATIEGQHCRFDTALRREFDVVAGFRGGLPVSVEPGKLRVAALQIPLEGAAGLLRRDGRARRRIEALLSTLQGPITSAETLRSIRAIEVLEHIATPE